MVRLTAIEWPLVGRAEELQLLTDHATGSPPVSTVIAGAAGVGKSKLLDELCTRLDESGICVVRCRATAAAGTIAFAAFADLWTERTDTATARVQTLRYLERELRRRAGTRSLAVAVDDMHHLDEGSAVLVHRLAAARECVVIGTLRAGEEPLDAVTALWKDGLALRIDLQPLSAQETAHLIEEVLRGPVEQYTQRRLYEATQGNPLFARELLADGVNTASVVQHNGVWRWKGALTGGPRLAGLVQQRLGRLCDHDRRALELLAIGEPLGMSMVQRLVGHATLNELERQGFAEVNVDGRRRNVQLAHPLYGEALRQAMAGTTRAEVSGILADELERTGARRSGDQLRLVRWRLDAGENGIDAGSLVRGARRALACSSYEFAERLASMATAEDPDNAQARLVLAEAQYWQGRFEDVGSTLAGVTGTPQELVQMAIVRSSALFWGLGHLDGAEEVISYARSSTGDETVIGELDAHRATLLLFAGDVTAAATLAAETLGRGGTSPTAQLRALVALIAADALRGRADEAVAMADGTLPDAMALADAVPHVAQEVALGRCLAQLHAGWLDDADASATTFLDLAVRTGAEDYLGTWAMLRGRIALARGEIDVAITHLADARNALEEHDPAGVRPWCLGLLAHARALSTDAVEAAGLLEQARLTSNPAAALGWPDALRADAWVHARHGDVAGALDSLQRAADVARDGGGLAVEAAVLHDIVRLGDPSLVVERLTDLAKVVDGAATQLYAAHAIARVAEDAAALETVAARFETSGFWLCAAEALVVAAARWRDVGLIARQAVCSRRAGELVARCHGVMSPTLERLDEHPLLGSLTRREREVGLLTASGLSNREIAQRLFLSIRTVGNHLNHIYAKLGIEDRSELCEVFSHVERVG